MPPAYVAFLLYALVSGGGIGFADGEGAAGVSVQGLSPGTSPTSGGANLTVTGEGFVESDQVVLGSSVCTLIAWHSVTSLACSAPAGVRPRPWSVFHSCPT